MASTHGSGIAFYPDLITGLEADHRVLLNLYGQLISALESKDSQRFKALLLEFRSSLTAHLLKEAVRLYIYLRQNLKFDPSTYDLVTHYKAEMDGIGKNVINFVESCIQLADGDFDHAAAKIDLEKIGMILSARIHREETELYPLYHNTYD